MSKTQQEVVRRGYQILVDYLGVVDALRFIQHFSSGRGDYTQERQNWLGQASIEDVLNDMEQSQDTNQYDEVIE